MSKILALSAPDAAKDTAIVLGIDWITFDCYGTLIDWGRGITDAFAAEAARHGRTIDRSAVPEAYVSIEPEVERGVYRPYREVLAVTAARVAARLGWTVGRERTGFLAESLPAWTPFPDTNGALHRLSQAGVRLGILSNVDDDLLALTRRHLEASFDLIITAQQVRSYKPGHAHFLEARSRIGGGAWLHAAQSYFHDVVPCKELAIRVAWINRTQNIGAADLPDQEFRDLTGLADWVLKA